MKLSTALIMLVIGICGYAFFEKYMNTNSLYEKAKRRNDVELVNEVQEVLHYCAPNKKYKVLAFYEDMNGIAGQVNKVGNTFIVRIKKSRKNHALICHEAVHILYFGKHHNIQWYMMMDMLGHGDHAFNFLGKE